jgi:hypothetical protein
VFFSNRKRIATKRTAGLQGAYASLVALAAILLFTGCAATRTSRGDVQLYEELISRTQATSGPLNLRSITTASPGDRAQDGQRDAYVIVHPAYSLFFRDWRKEPPSDAKFGLIKKQFENESTLIKTRTSAGAIVVLVIPGNYAADSVAPQSFVSWMNSLTEQGDSVYFVPTEASNSGSLAVNDVVEFYEFLKTMKIGRLLIGGGYIGRCQKEFYYQVSEHLDQGAAVIVPEFSSVSPDDITDAEAVEITDRLWQLDFSMVRAFAQKKYGDKAVLLPPQ